LSGGGPRIVALCMPERGHCYRLLGVVSALARRGATVHVLTDARFRAEVEHAGARFVDLFARFPLDAVDAESRPIPCRYVTFAGHYAAALAADVATLAPALVLYDTFAVVAPAVARRLGVPWVNVCAGHAAEPDRALRALEDDARVAIAPACREAVRRLREEEGMARASPFSSVDGLSPHLNVYGEPPEWLDEAERAAFEPLAFFGSLAPGLRARAGAPAPFAGSGARTRVYVSFGTVVWRYFEEDAWTALGALAEAFAGLDVEVLASLGGPGRDPTRRASIGRANVRVADYVDQWAALGQADLFVTHHGLNSTHEAIFQRAAMLSYPFFNDQPQLARRCGALGIALPLADGPRARLSPERVRATFACWRESREAIDGRLEAARAWETAVIEGRDAVVDRILALTRRG